MANTPNIPRNIPPAGSGNGVNVPNQANIPGSFERKENNFGSSVQRSRTVKQATSAIISSREDFVVYLKKSGLDLLTSAIMFQETGDFIASSFVVYVNHDHVKEPLAQFIQRYPSLLEPLQRINESLKPLQGSLQIKR
jgi:hypothetical protein